jgi:hypothetical protein
VTEFCALSMLDKQSGPNTVQGVLGGLQVEMMDFWDIVVTIDSTLHIGLAAARHSRWVSGVDSLLLSTVILKHAPGGVLHSSL